MLRVHSYYRTCVARALHIEAFMTNELTNQAGWIAFDNAYREAKGNHKRRMSAGYSARNKVIAAAIKHGLLEGPAEHPTSFGARSTMRQCGHLEAWGE